MDNSKFINNIAWRLAARRIERDTAIAVTDPFWVHKGAWLFSFGAYGGTLVLAFGSLDDALEDAAALLPRGVFVEPDYDAAREELGEDADADEVAELAETDLTYTEAGWLLSWEWGVQEVSLDDARALRKTC